MDARQRPHALLVENLLATRPVAPFSVVMRPQQGTVSQNADSGAGAHNIHTITVVAG
jgi:hypothetical protein